MRVGKREQITKDLSVMPDVHRVNLRSDDYGTWIPIGIDEVDAVVEALQEYQNMRKQAGGVVTQPDLRVLQDLVAIRDAERGYTSDLKVLALGLCEEAGEVAAAVLDRSEEFKPKPGRVKSSLEHEIMDCLVYLMEIANAIDLDVTEASEG